MWFYLIPSIDGVITGNLYLNDNMHGSLRYLIMWLKPICCRTNLGCCSVKLSIHRHSTGCCLQCSLCPLNQQKKTRVLTFATIMTLCHCFTWFPDGLSFIPLRWGLCISGLRPIDNLITALVELISLSLIPTNSHKPLISDVVFSHKR